MSVVCLKSLGEVESNGAEELLLLLPFFFHLSNPDVVEEGFRTRSLVSLAHDTLGEKVAQAVREKVRPNGLCQELVVMGRLCLAWRVRKNVE